MTAGNQAWAWASLVTQYLAVSIRTHSFKVPSDNSGVVQQIRRDNNNNIKMMQCSSLMPFQYAGLK